MPSALSSPSTRVRSRTSDISDFLRGRHDSKTSTDSPSQIPYVPRLSPLVQQLEPATPPKPKSKFAFLARKRKSSLSPSSAKIENAVSPDSSHPPPLPPLDRDGQHSQLPTPGARPSIAQQRALPPVPPSGIPVPRAASPPSRQSGSHVNTHFSPYGPKPNLASNFRKQKASSESTRRSVDTRPTARPIITVSPPHNNIVHEPENAYTAPRSAPVPSGSSSPERSQTSLPSPVGEETTNTPESLTPVESPSAAASIHSLVQLAQPADDVPPSATSYKEETLMRKDHFNVGPANAQPRRGTVSAAQNLPPPATVGFAPSRTERRHISTLQLSRLKKEIAANAPKIRKMSSESSTLNNQRDSPSPLLRSNTISTSPRRSSDLHESSQPLSPASPLGQGGGRRLPPPLKRTWHTPPITGPPREPLPSPPAAQIPRATPTPTSADSFRTAPSSPASPFAPRRALPPLLLTKELPPRPASRAVSPDESLTGTNLSVPPSPARSTWTDPETDREGLTSSRQPSPVPSHSPSPSPRTPVREDPARKALADAHATADELRAALQIQTEKYTRLSEYLLGLTERHALERAELLRRVGLLEQERTRREQELRGLRWLVAHAPGATVPPARSDSGVMPAETGLSMKGGKGMRGGDGPRDRSGSAATSGGRSSRSVLASSPGTDGRVSMDSQGGGSVEEGLFELQTTISEFIAPNGELAVGVSAIAPSPVSARRRMRSNTMPNALGKVVTGGEGSGGGNAAAQATSTNAASLIAKSAKSARRTSSPIFPLPAVPSAGSEPSFSSSPAFPSKSGLGFGLDGLATMPRAPSPESRVDMHARADSSTLSSLPSLSTVYTLSPSSGLSSIPETPRTDMSELDDESTVGVVGVDDESYAPPTATARAMRRISSSSTSSSVNTGSGTGSGGSSRVSASPSIGQVLDRTRSSSKSKIPSVIPQHQQQQPEIEAILRRLRAFGQSRS